MDPLTASLLGALQGLTEFLPVSSSGHLVLAKELLGSDLNHDQNVAFNVLVHLGSLIAILWVFRRDLIALVWPRINWSHVRLLVWVSIPAVIVGLTLSLTDAKSLLNSAWLTVAGLLVTSVVLTVADKPREATTSWTGLQKKDWWRAGWIGVAQAMAICPGISRSGSTIGTALVLGWERNDAVRLSFLMGFIALTGAGLLEAKDMSELDLLPGLLGFGTSLVFSLLGLAGIKLVVAKRKLRWFAGYTALLAITSAILLAM